MGSDDIPSDAEAEFRLHQGCTEEPDLEVSEDEEDEGAEGASCNVTEGNSFATSVGMIVIAFEAVYTFIRFKRKQSLGFEASCCSQWQGMCLH